jgi:hypothetical protein
MKPLDFKKISRPLYREITFIDLQGRKRSKSGTDASAKS